MCKNSSKNYKQTEPVICKSSLTATSMKTNNNIKNVRQKHQVTENKVKKKSPNRNTCEKNLSVAQKTTVGDSPVHPKPLTYDQTSTNSDDKIKCSKFNSATKSVSHYFYFYHLFSLMFKKYTHESGYKPLQHIRFDSYSGKLIL